MSDNASTHSCPGGAINAAATLPLALNSSNMCASLSGVTARKHCKQRECAARHQAKQLLKVTGERRLAGCIGTVDSHEQPPARSEPFDGRGQSLQHGDRRRVSGIKAR